MVGRTLSGAMIVATACGSLIVPHSTAFRSHCTPLASSVAWRARTPICSSSESGVGLANGHSAPSTVAEGEEPVLEVMPAETAMSAEAAVELAAELVAEDAKADAEAAVAVAPPVADGSEGVTAVPAVDEPAEEEPAEDYDPDRPPISKFDIDEKTVQLLASQGITNFTPIQAQTFDLMREGRDLLGRSRTGTGKTLAFALPLVLKLADEAERPVRGRAPRMLVLAPTRELANQVGLVIDGLAKVHRLSVSIFTGGKPYPPQQRALRDGIDILVGTPGRIIDHLENGNLDVTQLTK